jgi:hypothetical protein
MRGTLTAAELALRLRCPVRRAEKLLADFDAAGVAERVNGGYRLTPEYALPLRAARSTLVPLEPGDDDGLDHCRPGPRKAAA